MSLSDFPESEDCYLIQGFIYCTASAVRVKKSLLISHILQVTQLQVARRFPKFPYITPSNDYQNTEDATSLISQSR